MTIKQQSVEELLRAEIPHQQRPLFESQVKETGAGFIDYLASWLDDGPVDDELVVQLLVKFLRRKIYRHLEDIQRIKSLASNFNKKAAKAVSEEELNRYILGLAKDLGATTSELRKDRRALKRWMGKDTVLERCSSRMSKNEYDIVFYLQCLTVAARKSLKTDSSENQKKKLWQEFQLEKLLETFLSYVGDERLRVAVFRCLSETIKVLPKVVRSQAVKDSTLNYIYRSTLQTKQQVWIQVEALHLLAVLSKENLENALKVRLEKQTSGDDIFVRHHAILLIGEQLQSRPQLFDLLTLAINDISPYVRQAIPEVLARALTLKETNSRRSEVFLCLEKLLTRNPSHEVRGATLLILPDIIGYQDLHRPLTALFCEVLKREKHSFVLRTALKMYRDCLVALKKLNMDIACQWAEELAPLLAEIHLSNENLSVRRWTAQAINFGAVMLDEKMADLYATLKDSLATMKLGKRKSFPKRLIRGYSDEQLGRVLVQLAENNGSLTIHTGIFRILISKGDRFDFRFWRFFYELFHPSPDKRQAHNHTIGRVYKGRLHAPSPIMAELTQTKVPGEPLLQAAETGWRPYLPLVDQLNSSLSIMAPSKIKIYTAEGRTNISHPRGLIRRYWARATVTLRFSNYAQLRNWKEGSSDPATQYRDSLQKLGFRMTFSPYTEENTNIEPIADPAVQRFFPIFPFVFEHNLLEKLQAYTFTVYENSLYELAIFGVALSLLFYGLRLTASLAVNKARRRLPLVVGGWGTRGKSGVERLKAALFESMGHGILSKSTGCEAMFLHAYPFGRNQEMFLFRPYDKATIWEHHNLIKMADKMNCSVFLWECMGLTPAYVEILQHKWSKDDFSTMTNTYPDHEDIQGPAGYDIPKVMRCFIPQKGKLLSTEEQMQPILIEDALLKKTQYQQVGWLEAGLLTEDILNRFPYEEHPYNIALVVALAEQLGIERDKALKEMADRVIPDIGVLKSFPKATINGRNMEFINGMSANERFATLSNWERMNFETHVDGPDPSTVLHILVNNRADRISRSQMFAKILAEDVAADRYILIGSNLSGLAGYITSSWDNYLATNITRLKSADNGTALNDFLDDMAHKMRVPHKSEFLAHRFEIMLSTASTKLDRKEILTLLDDPEAFKRRLLQIDLQYEDEVHSHIEQHLLYYKEYQDMKARIEKGKTADPSLFEDLQTLMTNWFKRRIVVIEDFHATGDQVIDHICQEIPPGLTCRIMGMQNIKGTGLDFVYRWQAWERCWFSCNKLDHDEETVIEEGLNEMMAFQDYGLLSEDYVRQSIDRLNDNSIAQSERFQAGLKLIETTLDSKLELTRSKMKSSQHSSSGLVPKIIGILEAFLDAGDAIKRKKIADLIYKDLSHERISHQRAAIELQALNKRQKGGWLMKKLT